MVKLYCQLFGSNPFGSIPSVCRPHHVVVEPPQGTPDGAYCPGKSSSGVLSKRPPLFQVRKGGLFINVSTYPTRSRWKNWPTPPLITIFPAPVGSHAKPMRGAMALLSFSFKERLLNATPRLPATPASLQGELPGAYNIPLQGLASPETNDVGSKLDILLFASNGSRKNDQRAPYSTVSRGVTRQLSPA